MKRLEFDCDFDLVEKIETLIANDSNPLISVYGKFDIIKTLLKDFIQYGFDIRNEIELEDYNVSYYDKECGEALHVICGKKQRGCGADAFIYYKKHEKNVFTLP